ncbi:MAG TPA: hypothetical protein DCZ95_08560 [Verrucomicrobia bacterium]|nr:MAG: hypothetical protein A2X46_12595 [Lentisphaerae bacterium GWF2_57_35]HBA84130.1 hypothetical protein [Verrucomicrobiota bacterium]
MLRGSRSIFMRYFGSKFTTLPRLGEILLQRVNKGTFCDPFGGIGTVGAYFKSLGFHVWTGDVLQFAHCFQIARIHRQNVPSFRQVRSRLGLNSSKDVLEILNKRKGRAGWFVEQYARKRRFFTVENARAIEWAWNTIHAWHKAGWLNREENAVLIASLIHAMDQVANTAGTYYSFLKTWHRKAKRPFHMDWMRPTRGQFAGKCSLGSAETLVSQQAFDVLYLDPPYNERSYAHYYHLAETIAQGVHPQVHGISGIPDRGLERSVFNDRSKAASSLEELLNEARFKWLAFHYADDGLIPRKTIRSILAKYGTFEEFVLYGRGYTTQNRERCVEHRLYLLKHD